jgi:hypothetical protein
MDSTPALCASSRSSAIASTPASIPCSTNGARAALVRGRAGFALLAEPRGRAPRRSLHCPRDSRFIVHLALASQDPRKAVHLAARHPLAGGFETAGDPRGLAATVLLQRRRREGAGEFTGVAIRAHSQHVVPFERADSRRIALQQGCGRRGSFLRLGSSRSSTTS